MRINNSFQHTQDINLEKLPLELYGGQDTQLHERGLRGFAMLFQYVQLLSSLEKMGFNSTELTLYRVLVEQILTDACNWVSLHRINVIHYTYVRKGVVQTFIGTLKLINVQQFSLPSSLYTF